MSLTVNIYYKGTNGSARQFASEMMAKGVVDRIRQEEGNLRYEYFLPLEDPETVLLIDSWRAQEALDHHHQSPMMDAIMELRAKYDLHMKVERFCGEDEIPLSDQSFIRK
ncbi:MAG: antibiotic biosynthesis monooxygenase [Spirochaetales bacterium]|nr:antibiotic biosynthesis monooxygenase [Candidatus Physcosoma equi]